MKYTSIIFLSQFEALQIKPRPDTVMISLIVPEIPVSFMPGFRDVLQLAMHDISEERINVSIGAIPDEADHPLSYEYEDTLYIWPDMHHARSILAFLEKHECDASHIIVHCTQGKSRSSAVAKFASKKYHLSLLNTDPAYFDMVAMTDTSRANPRLLRLLDNANKKELA